MIIEDITLNKIRPRPSVLINSLHPVVYFDYTSHTIANISKLEINNIILEVFKKYSSPYPLLVIDSQAEAPSGTDLNFVDSLLNTHPGVEIIHLTSGVDPETKKYHTVTNHSIFFWPTNSLWINNFSLTAHHHFIALARAPKPHRTRFINNMINKNLNNYGYFSISCVDQGFDYDYNINYKDFGIDVKNLKYFPTLLEGQITYDMDSQYNISDPRISQALVNVVLETSYEHLNSLPELEALMWRVPFVTEKTIKAFALGQIPMILGPKGQVSLTRSLGFDLFDDFIDHSYDNIDDPYQRIEHFTNSLENFIRRYPRPLLQSLKNNLMPRFTHNLKLAKQSHMLNTHEDKLKSILDKLNIDK